MNYDFDGLDPFLMGIDMKFARFGGGGYSGPTVQEQDWMAEREAERQRKMMQEERSLAEQEAKNQREEAEAAARATAEAEAAEEAAKISGQDALAQAASEAAQARSATSDSSLSYRDVSLQAFQRGLIPDPDGRPE